MRLYYIVVLTTLFLKEKVHRDIFSNSQDKPTTYSTDTKLRLVPKLNHNQSLSLTLSTRLLLQDLIKIDPQCKSCSII